MQILRRLFKQTAIYGIATVLPRVLSLFLTPLYVHQLPSTSDYGAYSLIIAYIIFGNVVLSYGMETAFFRFANKYKDKKVGATALTSIAVSSIVFLVVTMLLSEQIANFIDVKEIYVVYAIVILTADALAVIPFAYFRKEGKATTYTIIKIANVTLNLLLNILLFLIVPKFEEGVEFLNFIADNNKVTFIFISNAVASILTLIALLPIYKRIGFYFDKELWQEMIKYSIPILFAGIAFSINESFDRIFLKKLLPTTETDAVIGVYSACYKMGVFMNLFITAYKLGVEPFFFSNANDKNAKKTYADITKYFTIIGSIILLFICTYTDLFKLILIPNSSYWEALSIVPFILLANLCLGIYHSLSVWYKVTDRTSYGAWISIIGSVITIVSNYALIPLIGFQGAAVATFVAYASMMIISYIIGQKKYKIPYNLKIILGSLTYSAVASFTVFFLFDRNMIIGTLMIIPLLILAYVEFVKFTTQR